MSGVFGKRLRSAATRSFAVSNLESFRGGLMSSELANRWAPAAGWARSFFTSSSKRSGDASEGGSSRISLDLNQRSGEIKPELVKKYLSEALMSRTELNKRALASERAAFARDEHDTGSSEVQIASLTMRIKHMTEHLREHNKDTHSRRGLMAMLERRKKLLKYLRRTDGDRYADTILRLGLKDRSFVDDKYA
ncbi:S15/NS1, RNA-binding [Ostreococcus tauri]|uniref:30S ribosomal protein S15 n=1 Tax=Ostreococcus tauri TaxID=70448 RepID=A0A090MCE9_OSTTA|nr:S15/NS1, RNA-binding [Ostreococcus tauri]CEG01355.1 S15/NS1, RNA-binding [Ostreococcus tauri]|eukprot:XP_022840906.1 S15/NS1, RNA-binding [Ostreococcus tauri]